MENIAQYDAKRNTIVHDKNKRGETDTGSHLISTSLKLNPNNKIKVEQAIIYCSDAVMVYSVFPYFVLLFPSVSVDSFAKST